MMSLTPYIGYLLTILGFAFSCLQATHRILPTRSGWVVRPALTARFIFYALSGAFLALLYGYITSDFSMQNVYENSHTLKPMLYKITGAWGNHEGSMLLFVLMLSVVGFLFARRANDTTFTPLALAFHGGLISLLLLYILFASSPFEVLFPAPKEGKGMNPLLQDFGLAIHPPMLYAGYVTFSIVGALTLAGLKLHRLDAIWARTARSWALVACALLTLGIGLGAWWAYRELGWGGYWFWDPVENASLLPWLTGISVLHCLVMVEKRQAFARWAALLSILTFGLCLLGFFLVRSGVLSSVHSFASDPQRGLAMLAILTLVMGTALWMFARAQLPNSTTQYTAFSRDAGLLLNNLLLMTLCFTVMLGTLYPLFSELLMGYHVSVGGPYFNTVFNPIALLAGVLLAITPWLAWKHNTRATALTVVIPVSIFIVIGITLPQIFLDILWHDLSLWAGVIGMLIITSSVMEIFRARRLSALSHRPWRTWGMSLAHLGLGILMLAIAAQTYGKQSAERTMTIGEQLQLADITLTLEKVDATAGANYFTRIGTFRVQQGNAVTTLFPEARLYPIEGMNTTEAAVQYGIWRDVYVVIGQQLKPDGMQKPHFAVRAYVEPGMLWIWLGAVMMALGTLLACRKR